MTEGSKFNEWSLICRVAKSTWNQQYSDMETCCASVNPEDVQYSTHTNLPHFFVHFFVFGFQF